MKKELLEFCWNHLNEKIETVEKNLSVLGESLNAETKSSAGDKHETGRAMIQLEQEKLGKQLLELEKTKMVLHKVDIVKNGEKIRLGSLVRTDSASYFIAISAGVFKDDGFTVFCVSGNSPIAKLLFGKQKRDLFTFNGVQAHILEVS